MENLEKLRKFLREIPHIGHGGCAIASLSMHIIMHKPDSHILYLYDPFDSDDITWYRNNSMLLSGKGGGDSCLHSVLSLNGKIFDCFEEVDISPFLVHVMPEEAVRKTLQLPVWNPLFNREKYLPLIEGFIGGKLL